MYQLKYPHTYSLVIDTIDDHLEKHYRLGSLLVGLTQLEFILVLIVLLLVLFLYLFSTLKEQQREFAVLQAIGWPTNLSIRFIWFSLLLIWFLSSALALIMSFICTQVYIPLLSDLLLFSIGRYSVDWMSWILAEGVLTLSMLLCFLISWISLKNSPTALLLREE
ncbi:MAG: FtsX-like permease family protein [Candidatus Hodarchaeales archaeon]